MTLLTYISALAPTMDWCEAGEHYAPADTITPATVDPAMGTVHIDSICEDCTDKQVAAYYG